MSRWQDEDDVRSRPTRRNAPRRSKDQPTHAESQAALVIAVDRGRITCALGADIDRIVTAVKARALGRKGIVVGDHVHLVGDISGNDGTLARIIRRDERSTILRRTADDSDGDERVIVANAEVLVIVSAVADPEPRPRLIDRYLVAAYAGGMTPMLVLTKSDLASPQALLDFYEPLGLEVHSCSRNDISEALRERLANRICVLVGHSGVGKSTLLNGLVPDALQRTGDVNAVTGRGRHTTTSATAVPYLGGGWLIDTPGIRSFGLAHVAPHEVIHAFPALEEGTDECPRGCTHDEAECGLDDFVASGAAGPAGAQLLESVRRLLRALRASN